MKQNDEYKKGLIYLWNMSSEKHRWFFWSSFVFPFFALITAWSLCKGYLRHKTIASQKVSSETQVKNFFVLLSYILLSRYSSFCMFNQSMVYQMCGVMISISTWDRVHFCMYLLKRNSLSHQTWPTVRYKRGQ